MSTYTNSYALAYQTPSLQQQIEVSVVTAAGQIIVEDPATANHAARLVWATWVQQNSSASWQAFRWYVATNSTIVTSYQADPTSVKDSDVQFVVNSNLPTVIANWKPPA